MVPISISLPDKPEKEKDLARKLKTITDVLDPIIYGHIEIDLSSEILDRRFPLKYNSRHGIRQKDMILLYLWEHRKELKGVDLKQYSERKDNTFRLTSIGRGIGSKPNNIASYLIDITRSGLAMRFGKGSKFYMLTKTGEKLVKAITLDQPVLLEEQRCSLESTKDKILEKYPEYGDKLRYYSIARSVAYDGKINLEHLVSVLSD